MVQRGRAAHELQGLSGRQMPLFPQAATMSVDVALETRTRDGGQRETVVPASGTLRVPLNGYPSAPLSASSLVASEGRTFSLSSEGAARGPEGCLVVSGGSELYQRVPFQPFARYFVTKFC